MRSMEQFKLMWTAFYFPVHDGDMFGFPDFRVDPDGGVHFSAMWSHICTAPYHPPYRARSL